MVDILIKIKLFQHCKTKSTLQKALVKNISQDCKRIAVLKNMKNVKLGSLFCSVAVLYIYILLSTTYLCSLRLAVLQSKRVFCSLRSLFMVNTARLQ